jgi:hypothetical protein
VALMRLYKRVSPRIKIFQTRFPAGDGDAAATAPATTSPPPATEAVPPPLPPAVGPLVEMVDWWCAHVCQWSYPGVPEQLAALRKAREAAGREFHATVYDNGVPIIEAPWERLRSQALNVWASNGTLDGTLSWYSVTSYGYHIDPKTNKSFADPWVNPMPGLKPGLTKYTDPGGWGYLVWPPPPKARTANVWAPIESARWVHTGAGLQDAEYVYALQRQARGSAAAAELLEQARRMATHFPSRWNPGCSVPRAKQPNWDDDGFSVDPGDETDGSSVVNEWKLAMAELLDKQL